LVGHRALHDAADSSATARSIAPACSHSFARRTATTWRAAWPLARWRTSSPTTIPTFVGLSRRRRAMRSCVVLSRECGAHGHQPAFLRNRGCSSGTPKPRNARPGGQPALLRNDRCSSGTPERDGADVPIGLLSEDRGEGFLAWGLAGGESGPVPSW